MTAGSDDVSSARDGGAAMPRQRVTGTAGSPAARKPGPGTPPRRARLPPGPPPRPRVVDEPGILGLSRLTRSRFGSRLFTWFFVLVFAVIVVQMISAILDSSW